jgi:hypothetical protein
MKVHSAALACLGWASLAYPAAGPLSAQTQIGGGICSSASLTGAYSLTLTGRDVASTVTFSKISESLGTATFDGQSKVTFSVTTNTIQASGVPQTLSGTYSLEANCSGVLNLASGDTASFTLEAFNNPTGSLSRNFLIAGNDGSYSFTGNGGLLPSTCTASLLSGAYAFNGTGFALTEGAVSGVNDISGLLQFDGKGAVTTTWYVSSGATTSNTTAGEYIVGPGCTALAGVTDPAGNIYVLTFALTSANGSNFLLSGTGPSLMFTGSGRTL